MKKANYSILVVITLSLFVLSCDKEKFPKDENLQGHWIEKADKQEKVELIFYDNQTMDFIQLNWTITYDYSLDKSSENLILSSEAGTSNHTISWNKKNDEITIGDLFPKIPEYPLLTVFKRK